MKRLLLTLTLLASVISLCGMEVEYDMEVEVQNEHNSIDLESPDIFSTLPPITLPQIYHHLSDMLSNDVARYIFSLQPGTGDLRANYHSNMRGLMASIHALLNYDGYCLTVEILERNLLLKGTSICDYKNLEWDKSTVLHHAAREGYTKDAQLILQVAGSQIWKLLTVQEKNFDRTALQSAAIKGYTETVKILLDAAGDKVQDLMDIQDYQCKTAFDVATSEVQELMLQYFQK